MMKIQKKSLMTTLALGAMLTAPVFAQDIQTGLKDLESERFAKAEQTFTQLASSSPSADNQFYLGYYYLRTNQLDKAKAAFEKGAAADPKNQLNSVGLGAVALAQGDRATAKTKIDQAVSATKSKNMDVLFRAGEAYTLNEKNNDPAAAIALLDAAAKLDKKNTNADIKMALGDAYFIKNDGGMAVSRYEDALSVSPNLAEANYKIGRLYLRGKNYVKAQEFFNKAIETDPEFALTYRSLADALAGSRAYKGAAANMEKYVQKSGTTDPDYLTTVAKYYFLANDYLKATSYLDQLKGKVNDPVLDRMYGWAYTALGKNEQAVESLKKFIATAPQKVIYDDYKYLGRAYGQLGTPEGDSLSIINLEKAAPEDTTENLYREIAKKYNDSKRYDRAYDYYVKTIGQGKPLNNDYLLMGLAAYNMGFRIGRDVAKEDTAAARQLRKQWFLRADSSYAKLAEITPNYSPAYYYRGTSNYYAYPSAEALSNRAFVPYLEKFTELAPQDIAADASKAQQFNRLLVQSYRLLAGDAVARKDDAKAKELASKILAIDPNDKQAKEFMEGPKPAQAAPAAPAAKPAPKTPAKKGSAK
ncbi:tetratricopeptide repeat protein [Rudanella lutea]|uniref:tetratricopeptide repeat protein n=1 Tax=Rudanella lutea TaxID=451374 RepID=UPI0003A6EB2F|nr:tetratricopeptide repeat protein [Rudanella lutea]